MKKTINVLVYALVGISFCSGYKPPLLSENQWKVVGSHLEPKHDKKMSMIHQKLTKISAYVNVKENVCPGNRESWGFLKHSENGEIFVENDFGALPDAWNAARDVDRYSEEHGEMKPFIGCMHYCLDLGEFLVKAVHQRRGFLIESLLDANVAHDGVKSFLKLRFRGRTPLMEICDMYLMPTRENLVLVRQFLRLGSDVNAKDNCGNTLLYNAAKEDQRETTRILLNYEADKEAKNECDMRALHIAALNNNLEILQILINAGADKEAKSKDGGTALLKVAWNGKANAARILVKAGADMEVVSPDGWWRPLHYAAMHGSRGVAKVLIDAGCDQNAKDKFGNTAFSHALKSNHWGVVGLFKEFSDQ